MDETITYALIHSPLVGPLTWQLIHFEMEKRGLRAVVPVLVEHPGSTRPFWQQQAEVFATSLARIPPNRSIVLVAHSGAGPILPAVRRLLPHSIQAYVFVDAGIPRDGLSRMALMRLQDPQWAEQFHQTLLRGERFPSWHEKDLREVIPGEDLRRQMVAEIHPRSLAFFTEPIPVFAGWPDAPCAYIKFSESYAWDFSQARQAGWPVREVTAGHFHMLVDPTAVTDLIVEIAHPKSCPI